MGKGVELDPETLLSLHKKEWVRQVDIRPFRSFPGALDYGERGVVGEVPRCPYLALG